MHPDLAYEIAKARQADLHRQAEHAAFASAARRARRRAVAPSAASPAAGLARRTLSMLAALARVGQGRSRPSVACQSLAPCADCA